MSKGQSAASPLCGFARITRRFPKTDAQGLLWVPTSLPSLSLSWVWGWGSLSHTITKDPGLALLHQPLLVLPWWPCMCFCHLTALVRPGSPVLPSPAGSCLSCDDPQTSPRENTFASWLSIQEICPELTTFQVLCPISQWRKTSICSSCHQAHIYAENSQRWVWASLWRWGQFDKVGILMAFPAGFNLPLTTCQCASIKPCKLGSAPHPHPSMYFVFSVNGNRGFASRKSIP